MSFEKKTTMMTTTTKMMIMMGLVLNEIFWIWKRRRRKKRRRMKKKIWIEEELMRGLDLLWMQQIVEEYFVGWLLKVSRSLEEEDMPSYKVK